MLKKFASFVVEHRNIILVVIHRIVYSAGYHSFLKELIEDADAKMYKEKMERNIK